MARSALAAVVLLAGTGPSMTAQVDSVTVVPGARYRAGAIQRALFGDNYRDVWATPIRVPVLNIHTYAGGLTPQRRGGFGQTTSLHFQGEDGRRYVFRSVDKDPSRRLAEELRGTLVADIIQDQISALNPGAALVVARLLEAANVLQAEPTLYVMGDTPDLGAYRQEFAGILGLMMENPDEGRRNRPGFAGSRLITGSERAFAEVESRHDERFAEREFLKARLLDVYLGDRDRHMGQWRWARFNEPGGHVWRPIPEDRDQAFINPDGIVMWMVRTFFNRKFINFSDDYPRLDGITWNGWDLDRYILSQLPRHVWDSVATDLASRLTDRVIDHAVRGLPPAQYEAMAPRLAQRLKRRRDKLPDMARRYYRMLAETVDVHGSDQAELAVIDRDRSGVTVTLVRKEDAEERRPHFRRRFLAGETDEIRVYLHGGNDEAMVRGGGSSIVVRVIGGGGRDELIDESRDRVFLYDGGGGTRFRTRGDGRKTSIDRRDFDPPPSDDPAHAAPPDWGRWTKPVPYGSYDPDIGLFVGMGVTSYRYGFRAFPFRSRLTASVGYGLQVGLPTMQFVFQTRRPGPGIHSTLSFGVTGIEQIGYYGFGNATGQPGDDDQYEVRQIQSRADWFLHRNVGDAFTVSVGVGVVRTATDDEAGTLLERQAPVGTEGVTQGEAGIRVEWDSRNRVVAATSGLWARAWLRSGVEINGDAHFRRAGGTVSTYLTPRGGPTLALRAGGEKVWGNYPFYEAAYLGGAHSLRGFAKQRFAGDGSVYGNGELRIPLGDARVVFPTLIGVHGAVDVGRVFIGTRSPGPWHVSVGGGVWVAPLNQANTLSITFMRSGERQGVFVRTGFVF